MSLVFSVVVVFLIVIGVLDVITNYEDNRCEMTYMFERPEYLVNYKNLEYLYLLKFPGLMSH